MSVYSLVQRFRVPETTSPFQKWVIYLLQEKLKLPGMDVLPSFERIIVLNAPIHPVCSLILCGEADIILILVFSVSLRAWIVFLAWFITAPLAYKWDLGPLYVSLSELRKPLFLKSRVDFVLWPIDIFVFSAS